MTLLASPSRERRKRALLPNGEPRYVHCYDNGATKKPTDGVTIGIDAWTELRTVALERRIRLHINALRAEE